MEQTDIQESSTYDDALFSHKFILGPMIGGSDLPFRLLCRRYGVDLAYSPMINSSIFSCNPDIREQEFQTTPSDRPLVVQFQGNDPEAVLSAALSVQDQCDAIDFNLGCPQRIAQFGHFGSFLLDKNDRHLVVSIVQTLSLQLSIPVFAKIRLLESVPDTLELVKQLISAGASLVAIHARYGIGLRGRTGPGSRDGPALLDQVAEIKRELVSQGIHTPIIANGNIRHWEDVLTNLSLTGADGVMSAEGLLENPALFVPSMPCPPPVPPKLELALEYLSLAEQFPVKIHTLIFHTRRIAREELARFQLLEDCVNAQSLSEVRAVVEKAISYRDNPDSFFFSSEKELKATLAAERRRQEFGRKRRIEAGLIRRAQEEGRNPFHYLIIGAETPTVEELQELKRMPKDQALEIWNNKHSRQHL